MSNYQSIPLEKFAEHFAAFTELSSVAIGARIVAVSDEFFAEAYHLLEVEPAPSMKGQFGPNGALYSGWETRRHNPTFDWCIIQLGTSGVIHGFDVDTANFNGNEAPAVSIYGLLDADVKDPSHDDERWTEILPQVNLGPSSRHLFKVPETSCYNFVKIHMYPDGGIARFRTYGNVVAVHPTSSIPFDLAHVFAGGRVLRVSDQHFGVGSNLILPGRGKNMGDGWETKRSRTKGHNDWVIFQLGAPGELSEIEIDTIHFLGNFPESCEVHALNGSDHHDWETSVPPESEWTLVLPRTKLGPNKQHFFELENVEGKVYTHLKVTIHPDGGIKRVRVIGKKIDAAATPTPIVGIPSETSAPAAPATSSPTTTMSQNVITIPVVPLTAEAFAPFGQLIQATNPSSTPSSVKVTPANGGTAQKFHKLSLVKSGYPSESGETTGVSIYRCQPLEDISEGVTVLKTLERHLYTTQAFIPMGKGKDLQDPGERYLVVVAQNGRDDKPDMETLKAFVATSAQGIQYDFGIWHQPMTVLDKPLDLACVETQIGDGSVLDCEILDLDPSSTYILKLD